MKHEIAYRILVCFGLGIAVFALLSYCFKHPEWTALTHTVPISSTAAIALLAYGLAMLIRRDEKFFMVPNSVRNAGAQILAGLVGAFSAAIFRKIFE